MDTNSLMEARKKAELAVADMPDGALKLKAFELILNRLLSAPEDVAPSRQDRAKGHRRAMKLSESNSTSGTQADTPPLSAPARVLELKRDGFFDEQRGIGEIRDELQTHGWRYDITALSGPLMKLVRARELRRAKVTDGNKTIYKYFNP
jgi:hypothetical protein